MVRQIMMYFLREKSHYGLKQIAYSFGGRDHSTAIHSKDTVINYMDVDRKYKAMVEEIGKAYLERF
jgi:chromosomal replication initiator protein